MMQELYHAEPCNGEVCMAAASTMKLPTWYRAFAVTVGLLSIVLALVVLVEPLLALWLLIFFLAFALLLMGIDRLVAGVTGHPFRQMMAILPPVMSAAEQPRPSASPPGQAPPPK